MTQCTTFEATQCKESQTYSQYLPTQNELINSSLICLSAGFLFTPLIGIVCAIANIVLAKLAQASSEKTWIPLDQRTVEEIKSPWVKDGAYIATIQVIYGIVFSILQISINQVALQWIKLSTSSVWTTALVFCRVGIIAPIIEEIIFRGFLQEKIKNIQVLCFGEAAVNSTIHKMMRVALQALIFGFAHYHALQGLTNIIIILGTGLFGFGCGFIKERNDTLGESISYHSLVNSTIFARVLLFGT